MLSRRCLGVSFNDVLTSFKTSIRCNHAISTSTNSNNVTFSSGKYARIADSSVVVQSRDTSIMVTAVSKRESPSDTSFIPLVVDYRDRGSAVGRIPHNFLRRELRPSDHETIVSRFVDRSIRPLFPEGYSYDTQVICNLLAIDRCTDPDVLCINGASASLAISDIPWSGPVAAVRVVIDKDGRFIIDPTREELTLCQFNLLMTCTEHSIVMVEGYGRETSDEILCQAILYGYEQSQSLLDIIKTFRDQLKIPTRDYICHVASNELHKTVSKFCTGEIWGILRNISHKKMSRDNELFGLLDSAKEHVASMETISDKSFLVDQAFWKCVKEVMNKMILDENIRVDGRGVNDLRPIECEVDLFKPLHGSARFRRGETEVISSVTFDSLESSIKADTISQIIGAQKSRNFMLHYEFPPFANNVTGRFMSASRREVGHGVLAERGIQPLLPSEFPFTIRVSSQVTDSNGSSSMATVCSGSLALFDAGVPMVRPAAGVACGLMLEQEYQSESERQYKVISDLSGIEDACGHMDFKIAGTSDGVTSCQLDIKDCHGLSCDMIRDAIMSSKESRHKVLDIMNQCRDKPRPSLKPNTPVSETMEVPVLKRHRIVGAGGHKIRKLIEETGAELATIDENIMSIFAPSQAIMDEVLKRIDVLLNEPEDEPDHLEMGAVYSARVVDIKSFGVMVELAPSGVKALLHLSQIDHKKVAHPDELGFQLGQTMSVKYFGRDPAGRLRISRKVLLKNPFRENSHTPATSQSVMEFIDETISKNKKKKKK